MIGVLITLLVYAAIAAIVWWAVQHLGTPQPIQIIVIVVLAIIGIYLLLQLLPVGGLPRLSGR